MSSTPERWRLILRWLLAAIYIAAGIGHLTVPDSFLLLVPDWVPAPRAVILATGVCEITGALALLSTRWRRLAGIMLAIYAVCVFPANIKHASEGVHISDLTDSWWYHAPRLAFQPVFVWWALFSSGVMDWPASKSAAD